MGEFTRLRGYDKWQFKFYWNDVIFKIMLYVVCFCCPLQQRNSLVFKIDNISSRVQTNKKLEQMTFSLDSEICESICKWLFAKLFVYSHVESEEKKTIVFLQSMFVKSSTHKGEYWLVQVKYNEQQKLAPKFAWSNYKSVFVPTTTPLHCQILQHYQHRIPLNSPCLITPLTVKKIHTWVNNDWEDIK